MSLKEAILQCFIEPWDVYNNKMHPTKLTYASPGLLAKNLQQTQPRQLKWRWTRNKLWIGHNYKTSSKHRL
eukprot:11000933-Ditylum_brightwellii.AAC.1